MISDQEFSVKQTQQNKPAQQIKINTHLFDGFWESLGSSKIKNIFQKQIIECAIKMNDIQQPSTYEILAKSKQYKQRLFKLEKKLPYQKYLYLFSHHNKTLKIYSMLLSNQKYNRQKQQYQNQIDKLTKMKEEAKKLAEVRIKNQMQLQKQKMEEQLNKLKNINPKQQDNSNQKAQKK